MPATYEPIATTTLGSAASTITFSSIPATYTDIRLVLVYTVSTTSSVPILQFNNDTSALYSRTYINGNGASASSARSTGSNDVNLAFQVNTSIPQMVTIDVMSYAGSTNKTSLITTVEDKNGSGSVNRMVALYRSTTAISTLNLGIAFGGNYSIGTTATLYGILKA